MASKFKSILIANLLLSTLNPVRPNYPTEAALWLERLANERFPGEAWSPTTRSF